MPEKVVQTHPARKSESLPIAIDAFKFCQAGYDVGFQIYRAVSSGPDEARRSSANSFDGLGAERCLFNINTWRKIFRHDASLGRGPRPANEQHRTSPIRQR